MGDFENEDAVPAVRQLDFWPEQREKPQVHVRFHTQEAERMLLAGKFDAAGVHAKMALVWATLYAAAKGYAG